MTFHTVSRSKHVRKEVPTIAIESSGLLLHDSGSWRSSRYREERKDYGKIHVLSGTDSLKSLAVRTAETGHDKTRPDQLMNGMPQQSAATAMAAGSAYWNHRCCNITKAVGLQPCFRPNGNAVLPAHQQCIRQHGILLDEIREQVLEQIPLNEHG